MSAFQPFANDSQSLSLGELTFENQGKQVNMYGSTTFTIDKQSLAVAKELQSLLTQIVGYLEANHAQAVDNSDIKQQQQQNVDDVSNPFL